MRRVTLEAEIEVKFFPAEMPPGEYETASPHVAITYDYDPGAPAYTPRGEYAPIDPPDPPDIGFVSAKLLDGDGLNPTREQLDDWAEEWLYSETGWKIACEAAESA